MCAELSIKVHEAARHFGHKVLRERTAPNSETETSYTIKIVNREEPVGLTINGYRIFTRNPN
jgi:hypothetical protein